MSSIFGPRRTPADADAGAGGKIVRSRRTLASERTPYARPKPPPEEEEESREVRGNPNWFAGLIRPAQLIATGAGKIISTVFGPDSPSSSSEESSIGDSDSGNVDGESEDDVSFQENVQANKESSSLTAKSANKCLIEQLLSQEEYSREESEELIKLIQSRVVGDATGRISCIVDRSHDVQSAAIIEAKKWLQEKRLGSGSKSRSEHGVSNLGASPQATESEVGSPIDVAKSYMQARPPWASPTLKHVEFRTPTPTSVRRSMDETPMSIFSSSLRASELKRSSLARGSWNILEEIRKVRSKATEELLASNSTKKIDAPVFGWKPKTSEGSLANIENGTAGDGLHNLTSVVPVSETKTCLVLEASDHHGPPVVADSTHNRAQSEALPADAANSGASLSQKHFAETNGSGVDGPEESGANGVTNTMIENGLPNSASSLFAAVDVDDNPGLGDTKDGDTKDVGNKITGEPNQGKHGVTTSSPMEENRTRDIPTVNEDANQGNGSEESTSMPLEDLLQDSSRKNTKQILAAKSNTGQKRTRAYTRRAGARGK